jgi:hypothetical protein
MNPGAESFDSDDLEYVFRRVMADATDQAWELRVDEEALAALYDILRDGRRRRDGRRCRPHGWRTTRPTGGRNNRSRGRPTDDGPNS